eukprot:6173652-Pleurochrysis_carterae.AAC.8
MMISLRREPSAEKAAAPATLSTHASRNSSIVRRRSQGEKGSDEIPRGERSRAPDLASAI